MVEVTDSSSVSTTERTSLLSEVSFFFWVKGESLPLTPAPTRPNPHANKLRPTAFTVRLAVRLSQGLPLPFPLRVPPLKTRMQKTPRHSQGVPQSVRQILLLCSSGRFSMLSDLNLSGSDIEGTFCFKIPF